MVIVATVLVTLLVKTYVVEAFYIPSASMESTLHIGDRVLVDKLSYDLHGVHRGDIVVFKKPPADTTPGPGDLIKRIIGLPGETVSARGGYVDINGKQLNETWLPKAMQGKTCNEQTSQPNNCLPFGPVTVPKGDYFVFGDNRTDSSDSRVFGPISGNLIVGKAFVLIWPLSRFNWF